MLCLQRATDPTWLKCALSHIDQVLVDHAHCEHKAAVTALSFVSRYSDDPELVLRLSALASEEAEHLHRVAALCEKRGLHLGHPERDTYAKTLLNQARPDTLGHRIDRLLVCSIIEARSCERLKLLAENLEDPDLRDFYDELWRCEAGHHMLFVELAQRSLCRGTGISTNEAKEQIRTRLAELSHFESELLQTLPVRPAIH